MDLPQVLAPVVAAPRALVRVQPAAAVVAWGLVVLLVQEVVVGWAEAEAEVAGAGVAAQAEVVAGRVEATEAPVRLRPTEG